MFPNSVCKAGASALFFAFDEEDEIKTKCAAREQLSSRTGYRDDRAFVVGYSATVEIAVAPRKREWIGIPALRGRRDDVVMTRNPRSELERI